MTPDKQTFAVDIVSLAATLEKLKYEYDRLQGRLFAKGYNSGGANEFTASDLPLADSAGLGHVSHTELYAAIVALEAFKTTMEANGNLGALATVAPGTARK
jgi:hypothetical protein